MNKALAILLPVLLSHYLAAPIAARMADPDTAVRWIEHIFTAVEATAALILLAPYFPRTTLWGAIGFTACLVGAFEEGQKAICSTAYFGAERAIPLYSGMCIESIGPVPYAIIAASALTIIYWRVRNDRKG